jgi:transcriptional regulator of arginine metabolism
VNKRSRQTKIAQLLRTSQIENQEQLLGRLARLGVEATQASVSRDLKELGVVKVDGVYQLPQIAPGQSPLLDKLTAEYAGDNLVVFRTSPGHASMLAAHIDRHRVSGLIGTIAGDDTIFAAVRSAKDQASVVKQVMSLVAMRLGEG